MKTPAALEIRLCDPLLRKLVGSEQLDVDMLADIFHSLPENSVHCQLSCANTCLVVDPRGLASLLDVHLHERLEPRCLSKADAAVNFRQVEAKSNPELEQTVVNNVLFDFSEMWNEFFRACSRWKVFLLTNKLFKCELLMEEQVQNSAQIMT